MKLTIQDANIVFDLHEAGILADWFRVGGYETWMTREVLNKITGPEREIIDTLTTVGSLKIHDFEPQELVSVQRFAANAPRVLSFPDVTAIYVASHWKAILLTGDKPMRNYAQEQKIEVHGSLWVIQEMVRADVMEKAKAVEALRLMMASDRRLPEKECRRLLKEWS